jgi:hypothetical protein
VQGLQQTNVLCDIKSASETDEQRNQNESPSALQSREEKEHSPIQRDEQEIHARVQASNFGVP